MLRKMLRIKEKASNSVDKNSAWEKSTYLEAKELLKAA
jgi:hypothetical protein